ncbi:hypothetical protein M404DRAFT_470745 [Pisolithus tinctorius Marx 270]|uniref:Uncharacterized protein n=1 Tax=Pisolithus tinctorius Marx 270 TaxID=870435 RepID=A0A0C3KXI9_PISTI|nr:hypothetical protein M404DRAFT_470745 [Pisolithus tinctorius Marx 270]
MCHASADPLRREDTNPKGNRKKDQNRASALRSQSYAIACSYPSSWISPSEKWGRRGARLNLMSWLHFYIQRIACPHAIGVALVRKGSCKIWIYIAAAAPDRVICNFSLTNRFGRPRPLPILPFFALRAALPSSKYSTPQHLIRDHGLKWWEVWPAG